MPGVMIAAWCIEIVYDFIKEGKNVWNTTVGGCGEEGEEGEEEGESE